MPTAGKKTSSGKKTLAESEVAGVFGIELAEPETAKPKERKAVKTVPVAKATSAGEEADGESGRGRKEAYGKGRPAEAGGQSSAIAEGEVGRAERGGYDSEEGITLCRCAIIFARRSPSVSPGTDSTATGR